MYVLSYRYRYKYSYLLFILLTTSCPLVDLHYKTAWCFTRSDSLIMVWWLNMPVSVFYGLTWPCVLKIKVFWWFKREFDLLWFSCSAKTKQLVHCALYDLHTISKAKPLLYKHIILSKTPVPTCIPPVISVCRNAFRFSPLCVTANKYYNTTRNLFFVVDIYIMF